jgi:hypothetical protein
VHCTAAITACPAVPTEEATQARLFLFPDYLHQYFFLAPAVELSVKDLFPGADIQFPFCDGYDHFSSHDRALHVPVSVILAHIVAVLGDGRMGRKLLQPRVKILVKPCFIVVDEHRRRDVHGVAQKKAVIYTALNEALFNLGSDVDVGPSRRRAKPQLFPKALQR